MHTHPAPRTSAAHPWGGALRSWLQNWPGQRRALSEGAVHGSGIMAAHCYGEARLLVADDNPVNLLVISALMASRGLEPVLAADGAEAVTLASERHFDLILMDLQMPILDGLAATAAIRRFESACARPAVPVIAYSSASPGRTVLARHGFNGGLSKPCDNQDLEDCLLQWCPGYLPAPSRIARAGLGAALPAL